ncbi:MAG: signal recognition particle-docking protein FtsY [Candidatus Micrarchaeota archaeon]
MFGLLKNKLKAFVDGIVKREETKPAEAKPEEVKPAEAKPQEAKPSEVKPQISELKPKTAAPAARARSVEDEIYAEAAAAIEKEKPKPALEELKPKTEFKPERKPEHEYERKPKHAAEPLHLPEKPKETPKSALKEETLKSAPEDETQASSPKPYFEVKKTEDEEKSERALAPKLGLFKRIRSVFSSEIEIGDAEVAPMLGELEIALLESDVSYDTTQFLIGDLKRRLVGKRVAKASLGETVRGEVRAALFDLFPIPKSGFEEIVKKKKASGEPLVVLFLGPNGMGKTTTIAKIARWLGERGYSSVLAAGDSFRAAAIEQLEHHGSKLGVSVIKHKYGADPTAVAFDAVAHARAKRIDVVLVDTAGRQETNVNLVREMEKMSRVLKPDLRVFVGEAVAGHALVEQLKKFKETAGVDALVLTKLDCDAKGGSAFSAAFEVKLPILFVGVGQEYSDLREFDAAWLVNNVVAA